MNFNFLIKFLPLLSTLFIILFLNIMNQKEYTKIKILIWKTPSLSIGTYIAISAGTGFLLSYITTTNLAKTYQNNPRKFNISSNKPNKEDDRKDIDRNKKISYDNTLIERDLKDPLPTINANFRVIGKTNKIKEVYQSIEREDHYSSSFSDETPKQYNKKEIKNNDFKEINTIIDDWNDDSYCNW
mgnify:CR=1 FL=1